MPRYEKTPVTVSGMEIYDKEPPIVAAILSWEEAGRNFAAHEKAKDVVWDVMPVLARALDRLSKYVDKVGTLAKEKGRKPVVVSINETTLYRIESHVDPDNGLETFDDVLNAELAVMGKVGGYLARGYTLQLVRGDDTVDLLQEARDTVKEKENG